MKSFARYVSLDREVLIKFVKLSLAVVCNEWVLLFSHNVDGKHFCLKSKYFWLFILCMYSYVVDGVYNVAFTRVNMFNDRALLHMCAV